MITLVEIKELLNYNPITGVFTYKVSRGGFKAGAVAGSLKKGFMPTIMIGRTLYSQCRMAWLWITGEWPERQVIRIDKSIGAAFTNMKLRNPPKPYVKKTNRVYKKWDSGIPNKPLPIKEATKTYKSPDREAVIIDTQGEKILVRSRFLPSFSIDSPWLNSQLVDKIAFHKYFK